jgi:hypothetical protein
MRRREFITRLGGAVATWPLAVDHPATDQQSALFKTGVHSGERAE